MNATTLWTLVAAPALLALATSCRTKDYATTAEDTVVGVEPGAEVDLIGEVKQVYGTAFELNPDQGVVNANEVLVVAPNPAAIPAEGDRIRVRGTLDMMLLPEVEESFDLDGAQIEVDFETEELVVAEAVSLEAYLP